MDNLCHSLAGAAIAQAGFAKRFPRATMLAVIGANIPDVDAAVYLFGTSAQGVAFRRGITHGTLAMVIWPLLLTWAFAAWNRRSSKEAPAGRSPWLPILAVAVLSVWSHPALDWLNTYGVRLLMPFSERWFYGDALFIVDPTLLVLFGSGWWLSHRRIRKGVGRAERPARVALALALTYIVAMKGLSEVTRTTAVKTLGATRAAARDLMVAPRPLTLLTRDVLLRTDSTYDVFDANLNGAGILLGSRVDRVAIGRDAPAARRAAETLAGRRLLSWSRFPYFITGVGGDSNAVFVGDARYARGSGETWAGVLVRLGTRTQSAAR